MQGNVNKKPEHATQINLCCKLLRKDQQHLTVPMGLYIYYTPSIRGKIITICDISPLPRSRDVPFKYSWHHPINECRQLGSSHEPRGAQSTKSYTSHPHRPSPSTRSYLSIEVAHVSSLAPLILFYHTYWSCISGERNAVRHLHMIP